MTAYNKMNGTHASHSKLLLDEILHKEWAFDGMTMSDWYGTYTTVEAVKAGLGKFGSFVLVRSGCS